MDPTLQKRLIGASVLIVLAIIFVPMLLDGTDSPVTETLPLAIPNPPERDFETRVVPIDETTGAAFDEPVGVAEAIGVAPPSPVQTGAEPDRSDAVIAANPSTPTGSEAGSGESVGVANSTSVTSVVDTNSTAPAQAQAAVDPAAASEAPATASGRFVIALGSYTNAMNAKALADRFQAAGFAVIHDSVQVNGQPATRLRLGPFATRGQAEAARLEVKRLRADLPAVIVELDDTPTQDAPSPSRSTAVASVWAVQIGAFKDENEAAAKRDALRQAGFAAFIEKVETETGALWRVRIGPEIDRADADAVKAGVKRRFGIDGIVVPYP